MISLKNKRKNIEEVTQENIEPVEEPQDTVIDNPQEVEKEEPIVSGDDNVAPTTDNGVTYERVSYSRYDVDDIYVKKVGYGPVLRVSGNRVLDMRSNTYYHIQGNMVHQDGGGPAFEINGSKIRSAFGGYLYEISGSNINKVFGGFYASISGNYITIHDLSEKYETTGTLNKNQILVVAALLFEA